MGALAPVQLWIPEDDLLLKNAVEAGASLESLAKGAVRFSHHFTTKELQDRWHSLLFDMDTSEKVSAQILDIENEQSISNNPKINRFCRCKSTKRKYVSLRQHYNAMRKRICNEPINFPDFNFDMPSCDVLFSENGHVSELLGPLEQLSEYCSAEAEIHVVRDIHKAVDIRGETFPDIVGMNEARADVTCPSAFNINNLTPDFSGVNGVSDILLSVPTESLEDRFGDGTSCGDNLCEHVDGILHLLEEKDVNENADNSYEKQTTNNASFMLKEGINPFQDLSDLGAPLAIDNDMENSHLPVYDSINEHITSCFNLEDKKEIKSESLDSSTVHQVEHSSQLPEMHMHVTIDGVSSPILSTIVGFELKGNDLSAPPVLLIDDMEKSKSADGNNTMIVTNLLADQQDDLMSIPLNFTNDGDITFIDTDGKYLMGGSCLESINKFLMDSPTYLHGDDTEKSGKIKAKDPDMCTLAENVTFRRELGMLEFSSKSDILVQNNVDILSNAYTLKPLDGSACCILNMEDPEIPCNDDIFPTLVDTRLDSYEAAKHPFTEIHLDNGNGILTNVAIQNQEATVYRLDPTSEIIEAGAVTHTTSMKCLNKAGDFKQEMERTSCTQTSIPSQDHLDGGAMELLDSLQASSVQKEKFSDSDHDAPSFSDIEALILEMDLDLDDQELPSYTREVSRYQSNDTRKSIIRLEQGAVSYMQRAIRSNGAFAVFYGRHLKHYIKKNKDDRMIGCNLKVVLGRTTRDSEVDIDLTKESLTNKISRQQAVIELEEDGSFSIMNIGRSSVVINGKEVARGKSGRLSSRCLIEIRNMVFTFEVNLSSIKKYLSTVSKKKSKATSSIFDWSRS